MISFIFETISLRDANFGLPDFGALLMHSTPDSNLFFSALLCPKTHKMVFKQYKFQSLAASKNNQVLASFDVSLYFIFLVDATTNHFYYSVNDNVY